MIFTFLGRVFKFAFTKFGLRIDLTNALVSIASSFLLGTRDKPMGDLTTHDVSAIALLTAAVWVCLRLLAGCYHTWQAEFDRANVLQAEVDRPEHIERQEMARIRASKKIELIGKIRSAQLAAANNDKELWSAEINEAIRLHPQACTIDAIYAEMKEFTTVSGEYVTDEHNDYKKMAGCSERLIDRIRNS